MTAFARGEPAIGQPPAAAPSVGKPAPDATIVPRQGASYALSTLRGKVVIINFWATWCGPCREELPLLDARARSERARGLVVLAVTTEDSVSQDALDRLFARLSITSLRHLNGRYAPLGALPTNYVIDRDGTLRYAAAGAFDSAALDRVIDPLLDEPGAAAGTEIALAR